MLFSGNKIKFEFICLRKKIDVCEFIYFFCLEIIIIMFILLMKKERYRRLYDMFKIINLVVNKLGF